jgi:hypothetical protein
VRVEGLGEFKKCSDIGSRTCDIPACSRVPQPTTLPVPHVSYVLGKEGAAVSCFSVSCLFSDEWHYIVACRPVAGQRHSLTSDNILWYVDPLLDNDIL